MKLSNSEINLFSSCRRHWYLRHYLSLTPRQERLVGASQLGTRMHTALESYYSMDKSVQGSLEAALKVLEDLRISEEESLHNAFGENIQAQHDMSVAMMEKYHEWVVSSGVDDGLEVLAVEQELEMPSPVQGVSLIGKLDLIIKKDGKILNCDHKVKASVLANLDVLNIDTQLRQYFMLLRYNNPEMSLDGGAHNMLQKSAWKRPPKNDKTKRFDRAYVYIDPSELDTFWDQLWGKIIFMVDARTRLDNGESHQRVCPPTPSKDCSWKCKFLPVCQTLNRPNDDHQAALDWGYMKHNPNDRYNSIEDLDSES